MAINAILKQDSLGARLASKRTVGFDYMRLTLALMVLYWHCFAVIGVDFTSHSTAYLLVMRVVLPLFFALSGFLVASSLDRLQHLPTFLMMRFLRIFPALVVETLLSAFILGPIVTTLTLGAYFTHPEFWSYLCNIVGWVHYDLPGVFKDHPATWVNRSLWTVPFELECYVGLSILYLVGAFRRSVLLLLLLIVFSALCAWMYRDYSYAQSPLVPGRLLIAYFIAGNLVYKLRDRLPGGTSVAMAMLLLSIALTANEWTTYLSPLPVAYASAALGCTAPKRIPVIFDGDYSYGMYLYAFPIQQVCWMLYPGQTVFQNFVLGTIGTALFAVFSWHAIEKPTVGLKRRIKLQARRREPAPERGLPAMPEPAREPAN